MGKVLIIGAGGVATVAAHKVAQNADVFYRDYDSQPHEIEMRRHCGGYRE